jgi:DNA-binding winged helix-turn-helix (wHTH) protein
MTAERNLALPLSFRGPLLRRVTAALRAGDCCSIVGVGGVGKTNLARFLRRRDVQAHYWSEAPVWVVLIDSNARATSQYANEFGVLELIVHRLICALEEYGFPADLAVEFDRLHRNLVAQPDQLLALRYIERIVARLLQEYALQIVLVFDQFDTIWEHLEPQLFLNLRYLRDEFKYRLVYVTMTRDHLAALRQRSCGDGSLVAPFWKMFEAHCFSLGAYDEQDSREMVSRIALRYHETVDEALFEQALGLTGGHPALLRALTLSLFQNHPTEQSVEGVLSLSAVQTECARIWDDLSSEEQDGIRWLASASRGNGTDVPFVVQKLLFKELAYEHPLRLFAPLFQEYVRQNGNEEDDGVSVDVQKRRIRIDGRWLDTPLAPLEFSMLQFLARNAGVICRREAILAELYPGEAVEVNDERIDTILRRLREALGEDGRNPRNLITHRRVGIRLVRGRVIE